MRLFFRLVLPVAQVLFTLALLGTDVGWRPLFGTPRFRQISRCDWDESAVCGPVVLPAGASRFAEFNLPAIPLFEQPYVRLGGPNHPDLPPLVMLCGMAGIAIWFFVGRFLDDITVTLLKRPPTKRRIYDIIFWLFVIASSSIVWTESDITSSALSTKELTVEMAALLWLLFGGAALLLELRWLHAAAQHQNHS